MPIALNIFAAFPLISVLTQYKKAQLFCMLPLITLGGVYLILDVLPALFSASDLKPSEEASRARSATESFLFRRLETLPQTTGRCQLNTELDIPFDGWGRMEVDLLCSEQISTKKTRHKPFTEEQPCTNNARLITKPCIDNTRQSTIMGYKPGADK